MSSAHELEEVLTALQVAGEIETREDGQFLAELSPPQWEVRQQGRNLILHIWTGDRNLTRRVIRILESNADGVALETARFGRTRPGKLEFLRRDAPRTQGRLTREKFRAQFGRFLAEKFPDARLESLTVSPDLEHSLSGVYPRGILIEAGSMWAVLGVSPSESASATDDALAFGLLWLDHARCRSERQAIRGLRLFLPKGAANATARRAVDLHPCAQLQLFECDEATGAVDRVDVADAGNLDCRISSRPERSARLEPATSAIDETRALAPETAQAIDAVPLPGTNSVALRFRGLDFARWTPQGMLFGVDDDVQALTSRARPKLTRLLQELSECRNPVGTETSHRFYRAAPERWLESLIAAEPERLDASLNVRHLYSQVMAVSAGDRGIVDLLGVTRQGRLIVIELKASGDIQLPLQALDYWQRVRHHHARDDFRTLGYFHDVELDPRPPMLWLVAPGFQFHSSTDTLLSYISPEMEVTRIGLNENWRRGLQVIFRR
jgi:hypothetical protein